MKITSRILQISLVTAGLLGAATHSHAQDVTLRFNNWMPPTHWFTVRNFVPWATKIEEVTEGRVKVELTKSSLGAPGRQFEIARDGVADITWAAHGYSAGQFDLTRIAELPFITKSAEAMTVALWRVYQQSPEMQHEHRGVKVLGFWLQSPGILFTKDEPIRKIDDFQGLTLRVATPAISDMSKALGAVPVAESARVVYELLSKGVVDGAFFNTDAWSSLKLEKFIHALTEVPGGFYSASLYVVMNPAAWNKISTKDQRAITACCTGEAMAAMFSGNWDEEAAIARAEMVKAGAKVHVLGDAEVTALRDKLEFLEQDWYARATKSGLDGKAAMKMLLEEQDKYISSKK